MIHEQIKTEYVLVKTLSPRNILRGEICNKSFDFQIDSFVTVTKGAVNTSTLHRAVKEGDLPKAYVMSVKPEVS